VHFEFLILTQGDLILWSTIFPTHATILQAAGSQRTGRQEETSQVSLQLSSMTEIISQFTATLLTRTLQLPTAIPQEDSLLRTTSIDSSCKSSHLSLKLANQGLAISSAVPSSHQRCSTCDRAARHVTKACVAWRRYTVLEQLATGGFGIVSRIRRNTDGKVLVRSIQSSDQSNRWTFCPALNPSIRCGGSFSPGSRRRAEGADADPQTPSRSPHIARQNRVRAGGWVQVLVWKELFYGRMNTKERRMMITEVNILREVEHQVLGDFTLWAVMDGFRR
jgi:hypothetical protein